MEPMDGYAGQLAEASTVLVGRRSETNRLRKAVDDAHARRGQLWLVSGEPGIGKTRVVHEVARYAGNRGARVLVAEGFPADLLWPIVEGAWSRTKFTPDPRDQADADAALQQAK